MWDGSHEARVSEPSVGRCYVNPSLMWFAASAIALTDTLGFREQFALKLNHNETVVFDLELDIINSLAHKYGLGELSHDMTAPEFRYRINRIKRAALIEEMTLPDAVPSKFGPRKQSDQD
jgi:hypothetical protein